LALYLLMVFAGAALLAPWVWKGIHAIAPASSIARHPFHRYVNRCLMALALGGIWPLFRSGFFPGLRQSGLFRRPGMGREIFQGAVLGFFSLAVIVLLVLTCGIRSWDFSHPLSLHALHLVRALGAASVVSVLEELLFRGATFGALRRTSGFWPAAFGSSVLYALVHFFQRPAAPGSVDASTGFEILLRMSAGFANGPVLIPGFINLTLAGLILAAFRERTGALWCSIGLHAGWIFWLKSYAFLTHAPVGAPDWFWGSSKLIDGWLAFASLLATVVGLRWVRAERAPFESNQEGPVHAD
jgi:membrane protease YdiL (CAAX protease family)